MSQAHDQASRQRIASDLNSTLFVEAGAGTGKTTALVQRIINLVTTGDPPVSIQKIAAITFTEKAAGELRDRIRAALEAMPIGPHRNVALFDLNQAAIQTIHGFAQRILSERPLDVGIPPSFQIVDDGQAAIEFDRWWLATRDELLADPSLAEPWSQTLRNGVKASDLKTLVGLFRTEWHRLLGVSLTVDLGRPLANLEAVSEDLVASIETCTNHEDKLFVGIDAFTDWWARKPSDEDLAEWLNEAPSVDLRGGAAKNWTCDVKGLKAKVRDARAQIAGLQCALIASSAAPIVAKFAHAVVTEKKRQLASGQVEFQDLLILAVQLLRENETARRELSARFERILVDEFQDTDPLQIDLVTLLATNVTSGPSRVQAGERVHRGMISPEIAPGGRERVAVDTDSQVILHLRRDASAAPANTERFPNPEFTVIPEAGSAPVADPFEEPRRGSTRQEPGVSDFERATPGTDARDLLDPGAGRTPGSYTSESTLTTNDFDWRRATFEPGKLFFVGDPKQSIYRFRGADFALYREAMDRFGREPVRLQQNFRSSATVLGWVNEVFGKLLNSEGQAPYVDLLVPEGRESKSWPVRLIGGLTDEKQRPSAIRTTEANDVTRALLQAKQEGWLVRGSNGQTRPIRFDDMAVLFPARTILPFLERTFREFKIPYRVESRTLLFETEEVRELTSTMAAIADPTDQVATIAALKSPLFACSDLDLLAFIDGGGSWDCRSPGIESGGVAEALSYLHDLHRTCSGRPVADVLGQVIHERQAMEVGWKRSQSQDAWRRIRLFQDLAREFDRTRGGTLRGFLQFVDGMANQQSRVAESVVAESGEDAVRLLTIHASKGLEFPFVILAGLGAEAAVREAPHLSSSGEGQLEYFASSRLTTAIGLSEHEDRKGDGRLEQDRLLYVGATRARDHLLVSLHARSKKNTMAQRLVEAIAEYEPWQPEATGPYVGEAPIRPASPLAPEGERAKPIPVLSATLIAAENSEHDPDVVVLSPGRKGGTNLGRAVHAVLQSIALSDPQDLPEVARAQAAAEEQSPAEVERLVRNALASPFIQKCAQARHWREVFVSAQIDGVLVEGFIDLLAEVDGQLVVVDYKTDDLRDDATFTVRMLKYERQAAVYALALEQTIGRRPRTCAFVFLRGESNNVVEVQDLERVMIEVRGSLSSFSL